MVLKLTTGLCLAMVVSLAAETTGALTARAAIASTLLGAIVFTAGGYAWSIPLLTFFISSSIVSHTDQRPTSGSGQGHTAPRRSARQVLANGSVPGLWALSYIFFPVRECALMFGAALATATADTWATEIGAGSRVAPRDVCTGRRVPPDTSGGITPRGLLAAVAGSLVLALTCLLTGIVNTPQAAAVGGAGLAGSVADSVFGATLQERRWCETCLLETEIPIHRPCGTPSTYLRGLPGFDNDAVNLTSCFLGSMVGLVLAQLS